MTITAGISHNFKQEILVATHNLTVAGDTIMMALYLAAAALDATVTTYTVGLANQASGSGYTAGGKALVNVTPILSSNVGCADFADVTWATSSITARGAQMYNASKSSKSIAVLDFGSDKVSSAGDFTVVFPVQDSSNAIIRIT